MNQLLDEVEVQASVGKLADGAKKLERAVSARKRDEALLERQRAIARLTADAIKHPMHNICTATIASLHGSRMVSGKTPRGVLITGLSGSGKSTVARSYARDYQRYEETEGTVIPVLYVELPSQPTAKAIAERILNAMGDDYSERGGAESKLHRIRRLLDRCMVELVIIDEVQHIVDNLDARARDIAGDMLKNLMNESCIPFVFLGLPSCRSYFVKNQQLGRRCTPKIVLRPFGLVTEEEGQVFQSLLKSLEERLPFAKRSALLEVGLIEPLWFASFGLIGQLTQLVAAALDIALHAGAETLTREHLSRAFASTIYEGCPPTRNPFGDRFNNRPLTDVLEPFHGFEH